MFGAERASLLFTTESIVPNSPLKSIEDEESQSAVIIG